MRVLDKGNPAVIIAHGGEYRIGLRGSVGSVGEYGWGGAYHSSYWVDPAQELVVVYLTQVIPAAGLDDHAKLRALIYAAIID